MKKIGLVYVVEGKQAVQQLAQIELKQSEITASIKEAKKVADGKTYAKLREEQLALNSAANELKKTLREQDQAFKAAKFPTDSLIGLRQQYRLLIREIEKMSSTDPGFDKKAQEAAQLSRRINDLSKQAGNFKDNIGRYEESIVSALDSTGAALSGNISGLIAGLGAGGAIGAILQLGGEAAEAVSEMVAEVNKARTAVRQLTGETGAASDDITSRVLAIADTFGTDYNEVLIAANALTKQLTGDFNESFRLIEQGLLSGANANGEFFDSVREYPAFFREMGLSGEQFIAVISQGVREGVFSDKGVDLIKEFNIRVREMPKATADAFNAIGLDSERIKDLIEKEGVGAAFIAVQKRLGELREDSPLVGQALADIFGGPGEDAGIQFIKTLDLSAEGLQKMAVNTDGLTALQKNSLVVNKQYRDAQIQLAQAFDNSGFSFRNLGVQIKTFGVNVLIDFLNQLRAVGRTIANFLKGEFKIVTSIEVAATDAAAAVKKSTDETKKQGDTSKAAAKDVNALTKELERQSAAAKDAATSGIAKLRAEIGKLQEQLALTDDSKKAANTQAEISRLEEEIKRREGVVQKILDARKGVSSVLSALDNPAVTDPNGTTESRVQALIAGLDLENKARISKEEEVQGIIASIKARSQQQNEEKRKESNDRLLAQEQEFLDQQLAINEEAIGAAGEALGGFLFDQEATFKDFLKSLVVIALDYVEKQMILAIAQASAASIASPESVATFGAAGLAKAALLTGIIKGIFAVVKSQVQQFAEGGQVLPAGRISARQNIPVQSNGDNVLATVRTGEMILNDRHQRRMEQLFGANVWGMIGVPGFDAGGRTPVLVNPNAMFQGGGSGRVSLADESINAQAAMIAERLAGSLPFAVAQAIGEEARRAEKRRILNQDIQR